ncbi:MAG: hypothetical protein GTO45_16570 [Candidatus Aminicenantes bacterium]|nr:hypothetical protein [Candidatus Aminicenantes bacterium]NIM80355.1 hypothetical protein [Candidatus Aminicenantes bacterium]NIN19742.1 hypothetical protein [Candidatus Aminicenantes bacterium]NIN43624.1 hypothetical protein [Candidatus Aminicenantes bacterium]NIN86369.1 hypothetical protein [Candidatus Aminicenantes bacterium]
MKLRQNFSLKISILASLLLLFNLNIFCVIFGNGSGGGYGNGEDSENSSGGRVGNIVIEMYVIEGARYFLNVNSDIMTFLNRVESTGFAGMDFVECQQILDRALQNMQYAAAIYDCLIWLAEMTPYNEEVIAKLAAFDYTGFMMEKGLNGNIFEEVEGYLLNGDITGVYKNISARFKTILDKITYIKGDINSGKFPALSQCWELSETCCQTLLFGQYVSRVFYAIQ